MTETVKEAGRWLTALAAVNPNCRIYYVMGNHDRLGALADHLDEVAAEADNFKWTRSHLRIGSALFLHGDSPFRRPMPMSRARRPKARILHVLYRLATRAGVHRPFDLLHSPRRSARRIMRRLVRDRTGLADGLTDVYFGHTHRPFEDYPLDALLFHNTGAAIRAIESRMLPVRLKSHSRNAS